MIRHAIGGNGPHDDARAQQFLEHRCGARHLEGHEVAVRRNMRKALLLQPRHDLIHAAAVQLITLADELLVIQCSSSGSERQAVDVERLAHAVHQVGYTRRAHGITHAQAGESVHFRKGTGNQQIGIFFQPRDAVVAILRAQVFVIGLVEHHQNILRQTCDE